MKKKVFRLIAANPNDLSKKRDNDLAAVLKTSSGVYYAAGTDGFYSFDPISEVFTKLYKSSTFSLSELPDGRVLMGTGSGLVIYNTVDNTFVKYINDAANPKSLINNHINKVLIDKAGNIWAGTNEGLSILKQLKSDIKNYFYIPDNSKSLSSNKVSSILQDSKNRIWIGTKDKGLNLWETSTNTFKHFKNDPKDPNSISSNNITKIYEDHNGDLWIGLWAGIGFNKFDPKKNKFTRYAINENSRKSDWYNDILEDLRGNFWLGFWGSRGFQNFDRKTGKFLKYYYSSHVPIRQPIRNLLSDGEGNLFVKTDIPIIYIYEPEGKQFKAHVSADKYFSDTLTYKHFLYDLPVDPKSIYFVETNQKGLTLFATEDGLIAFDAKKNKFTEIKTGKIIPKHMVYSKTQKLFYTFTNLAVQALDDSLNLVSTCNVPKKLGEIGNFNMICDSEGAIWVMAEKGVFRFFPKFELWEEIDFNDLNYHFEKTKILAINGEILVSSSSGLWRINLKDLSIRTKIERPADSFFLSNINYLSELDNGKILIVSVYGIATLDLSSNEIEYMDIQSPPSNFGYNVTASVEFENKLFLSSNMDVFELDLDLPIKKLIYINKPDKFMVSSRLTSCMLEDKNGNIWIGTTDGGLNRLNPKTEIFDHYSYKENSSSISGNEIICIALDSENTVWIGTNNGLCSFDNNTSNFKQHSKEWNGKRIESITCTSDSILWLGTNKGLIRYNSKSLKHQYFLKSDGFPTTTFNKGASLLKNGLLIMATNQGIVTFDPDKLVKSKDSERVKITGFNLFDEPYNLNIQSGDTIKLNYKKNFFTIDFSTMNFDASNSSRYSYNITGMGEKWVSTSSPSANFTNLPAGEYVFSVCKQGFENKPEYHSHLAILISPPFWKTIWFWALNFIVISSIGIVILVGYIKQIKMSEQNALLEQKFLTSQMNPHFIFNSLSAIQSFIYKNEAEVAGNYLADFSSLVRLILENSRSEWISLEKEFKTLRLYIGLQQLRFSNKFDYEIIIDPNINIKTICIPPMLAQPFVENSIEHGIMHLKTKGNISIHFGIKEKTITIEVVDDGIGLKQSKLINLKKETHTSFASSITYERLTNLTRAGNKNIGISVTDRSDAEGINGTRINLEIPFKTIPKKNKYDKSLSS